LRIEKLSKAHNRSDFNCGNAALNDYLKRQASQDARKNIATVIAAVDQSERVAGFYTLCASGIQKNVIPSSIDKRLPKYNLIPVILLGRLAVSETHKGRGLGKSLMLNAFERCARVDVAWCFLVADAKDERARSFYLRFGFISLLDDKNHLCLPKQAISIALINKE
jgi:GNAT superfamily N-acetyltransferase